MDPTSGLFAGEGHIPLSATPHPASSAPITGATDSRRDHAGVLQHRHPGARGPAGHAAVHRRGSGPRSTRSAPAVDERLVAGDVRLTMGGEPTFVSIDDQVDPEWTTDADGPHKRERASVLADRLKTDLGAAGSGAAQPGQVVSRENRCRAGRSASTGGPTGSRCGPTPTLLADPWAEQPQRPRRSRPTPASSCSRRIADGLRPAGHPGPPGLRGRAEQAGQRGPAARR